MAPRPVKAAEVIAKLEQLRLIRQSMVKDWGRSIHEMFSTVVRAMESHDEACVLAGVALQLEDKMMQIRANKQVAVAKAECERTIIDAFDSLQHAVRMLEDSGLCDLLPMVGESFYNWAARKEESISGTMLARVNARLNDQQP